MIAIFRNRIFRCAALLLALAVLPLSVGQAANAASVNRVVNGDFSDALAGWSMTQSGNWGGWGSGVGYGNGYIFSLNGASNDAGAFRALSQVVDLTGVDAVTFVYRTTAGGLAFPGTPMPGFVAEFLAGGAVLWTETTITSSNRNGFAAFTAMVDVSGLSGATDLTFRMRATQDHSGIGSHRINVDDVSAVGPALAPVPLPATGGLALAALGALGLARRRRG